MDCAHLGEIIKTGRTDAKMTQKELGDLLHVSDKAVSKWERGICFPDVSLIEPISKVLNVPLDVMLSSDDKKKIQKCSLNKKLLLVSLIFLLIGIFGTILFFVAPIGYVKRMHAFLFIVGYLLLFIIAIFATWKGDGSDTFSRTPAR